MVIHDIHGGYPLVDIQKAIEHGPVEIVDLPSFKNGGSFQFAFCVSLPGRVSDTRNEPRNGESLHRLWGDFLKKIWANPHDESETPT